MHYSKPALGSLGRRSRLSDGLSGPAYRRHQASSAWYVYWIGYSSHEGSGHPSFPRGSSTVQHNLRNADIGCPCLMSVRRARAFWMQPFSHCYAHDAAASHPESGGRVLCFPLQASVRTHLNRCQYAGKALLPFVTCSLSALLIPWGFTVPYRLGACSGDRRRSTIAYNQNDSTSVDSGLGHGIFHGTPLSTSQIHGSLPVFTSTSHSATTPSNVISPLHSPISTPGLERAPYHGNHPPGVTDVGRLELHHSTVIHNVSSVPDSARSSSHSTASSSSSTGHQSSNSSSSSGRSRRSTSSFSARYDIPQYPRRGQRWKPGRPKDTPGKQLPDVLSTIEELDELRHGRLGAQQDRYLDAFIQDLLCPRTNTWQLRSEAAPSNTQRLTPEEVAKLLAGDDDVQVARSFADLARAGSITAALQLLKGAVERNHRALPRWVRDRLGALGAGGRGAWHAWAGDARHAWGRGMGMGQGVGVLG
jgi:hypothetical protein